MSFRDITRVVITCTFLLLCSSFVVDAQVEDQAIRLEIANRRLEGTTYMADVWVMIMPDTVWYVCDGMFGFSFNRDALNASFFDLQPLLNLDPELLAAGYSAQQYYFLNIRVLKVEIFSPISGYVVKNGGYYGSSFKLGTVRWQAANLAAIDHIKFEITQTWMSRYNPGSNTCTQLIASHAGIPPLHIQPTGCVPIYYDQPANCTDPLSEYETLIPLARICPHWPAVAGPGIQTHRVYYQYYLDQTRMPSVARTRDFNGNDVSAIFDRARCRWEAQIDQLTPPVTDVFEWVQTSQGGRMYFATQSSEISDRPLEVAGIIGLVKWARNPNSQWELVDSANCGTARVFRRRSELLLNNSPDMYLYNPHYKWTTNLTGCGGGPDCLDVYGVVLHELGHYIGLAHQPNNHLHVMYKSTIWPFITELTLCDADNARRLYNPARIGYPVDNSYDCSRFTSVAESSEYNGDLVVVCGDEEFTAMYVMQKSGHVRLDLVDVLGRTVAPVVDAMLPAGSYTTALPTHNLAPGLYFVVMRIDTGAYVQKLFIAR